MVSFYVQYGFSQWKRHGNHSRVEKDTGFIIVVKMGTSRGTSSQKVSTPRFLRVAVTRPRLADVIIPHGGDLSHVSDHSYSTHCPISTSSEA